MTQNRNQITFTGTSGEFEMTNPSGNKLYLPVGNELGLKSAVTPSFGGDAKVDQNTFILEPESIDNLHNNRSTRNVWAEVDGQTVSLTGVSAADELARFQGKEDACVLRAGFMWQETERKLASVGITAKVRLFAPLDEIMEIMQVTVTNDGDSAKELSVIGAIPIYGRSADNLRDHRHVTALLHRIHTTESGVTVKPVLSFDERGHQRNHKTYFVLGTDGRGNAPQSFYPTVDSFIGDGTFLAPGALAEQKPGCPAGEAFEGEEAMGALRFGKITLAPGESASYAFFIGVTEDKEEITVSEELAGIVAKYKEQAAVDNAYEEIKKYWTELVNVSFHSGSKDTDQYLKWICFQPILRRIYGCSFLPYHDYGRGGRGWRDLWQDCLSLLIMDPKNVRNQIVNNYAGVRIDGTNATIIGDKPGEFVADRNSITRVWMDHAYWPWGTTKLYMDQTGDMEILQERVPYFKDPQSRRGTAKDNEWNAEYGMQQKTDKDEVYRGSILEHILLQNLAAFYEVGEHNIIRLRGADWNDAIDMAADRGESVAFTCAYVGSFGEIADYLEKYEKTTGIQTVAMAKEMEVLLAGGTDLYESVEDKKKVLDEYLTACAHNISGEQVPVELAKIRQNLREKAEWYAQFLRRQEWVSDGKNHHWMNGYYDNSGKAVEGVKDGNVRMMLTGQVFSIMGNVATDEMVAEICASSDAYLYEKSIGGYRLNTDFHEEKFDMGRMFGFAYGEKENGAVFSHMTVMYANALYRRGFVKEGYVALQTLLDRAMDKDSQMYPGVPEYFDGKGIGKYGYLTGAASWYMLTMVTQVYGFRGEEGNLVIEPKLLAEQFDENGSASAVIPFRGQEYEIRYENSAKKDYGSYQIDAILLDGQECDIRKGTSVVIPFAKLPEDGKKHEITVVLN